MDVTERRYQCKTFGIEDYPNVVRMHLYQSAVETPHQNVREGIISPYCNYDDPIIPSEICFWTDEYSHPGRFARTPHLPAERGSNCKPHIFVDILLALSLSVNSSWKVQLSCNCPCWTTHCCDVRARESQRLRFLFICTSMPDEHGIPLMAGSFERPLWLWKLCWYIYLFT